MLNMRHYGDVTTDIRRCEELLADSPFYDASKKRTDAVQRKARALLKELLALKEDWDARLERKQPAAGAAGTACGTQ